MTKLYPEPIDKLVAHLCDLVCNYARIDDMLTGVGSMGDLTNQPDGLREALKSHDDGFPNYHHWLWLFNEARLTLGEWHSVMDDALSSLADCAPYTDRSSDPAIDRWSATCRRQLQELRRLVPYPETLSPNGRLPSAQDLDRAEELIEVVRDRILELQGIGPEAVDEWRPRPGYIGAKKIEADHGVPRSTLSDWVKKDAPAIEADPKTGEQHVPDDWLQKRLATWKKGQTTPIANR